MDRNSEEYQQMRDKALSQLRSGESLTGKDAVFGPLLKEFFRGRFRWRDVLPLR